jgi:uncharacterized Zn finger protein (UPF0148 family)
MTSCPQCGAPLGEDDFAFEGRVARCSACGKITELPPVEVEQAKEQSTALTRASVVHWDQLATSMTPGSLPWNAIEHGISWEATLSPTLSQRRRGRQAMGLAAILGVMATLFFMMLPLRAWVVGVLPAALAMLALDLVRTSLRLSRGQILVDVSKQAIAARQAFGALRTVRVDAREVVGVEVLEPDGRKRGLRQAIGYDVALRLGNGRLVPLGFELDVPAEAGFVRAEIASAIDRHKPGDGYR